jgi:stress response protein SCP2
MKRKILLFLICLLFIPAAKVQAKDYTLKSGKEVEAGYAGQEETDYNYFKFTPAKKGFAEIKIKTSDGAALQFDICNSNKEVIAENIKVKNKNSVLHKVSKGKSYYVRVKGNEGATYTISYKMVAFDTLTYAKKYSYTFTNASFNSKKNGILLKVKARDSGNLSFMCKVDSNVDIQYLNNKKKPISSISLLNDNNLTGIGVKRSSVYYIKLWKPDKSSEGTTTITGMKYQIDRILYSDNSTQRKAKVLSKGKSVETLVLAGTKTTTWYKITLSKKQSLTITFESHLLQNNGNGLKFNIYAVSNGKAYSITKNTEPLSDEATATYSNKKYKMNYPKKKIQTGELPAGTYYLKIESENKTTSGSYKVNWK